MKKRLRKKKHIGEFREDGFTIKIRVLGDVVSNDDFFYRLLDFVESIGCEVGGGGSKDEIDFFCTRYKGSCADSDREAVSSYLGAQPEVSRFVVGPLVDAWNASEGDYDVEFEEDNT
jgi:uncharacterized protein YggL (DUF469 family)